MRLGLFTLATDESMPFGALAREAEDLGFDILLTGEQAHIPVGAQVWSVGLCRRTTGTYSIPSRTGGRCRCDDDPTRHGSVPRGAS
jgi:alkanesulfonate monooxygenase SsuD/methylene tetrahydromethanopterin reductase-like flavin-dependent oxidoreductase (luciferase family)